MFKDFNCPQAAKISSPLGSLIVATIFPFSKIKFLNFSIFSNELTLYGELGQGLYGIKLILDFKGLTIFISSLASLIESFIHPT